MRNPREPFSGRFWGIFDVEGDDPSPLVMFPRRADALSELDRRRALDVEHDGHLGEYHQVFSCDVVAVWWNSYDPDPRAESPLLPVEVLRAYDAKS